MVKLTVSWLQPGITHAYVKIYKCVIIYLFLAVETEREEGEYQDRVREAMDWWQNSTCVEFQLVTKETETGNAALIIRMRYIRILCAYYKMYKRVEIRMISRNFLPL